jgi:hypothetical protein
MNYGLSRPPKPLFGKSYFNPGIAYSNTNSRQAGINFENQVHYIISNSLSVTNICRERDVINHYGTTCTAIDHMIDNINANTRFCIQSKWKNSKESLDYIHHFIKCVETVQKCSSHKVFGIMLSKQPITAKSESAFKAENLSNSNINFINIYLEEKYFDLEESKAQNKLIDKLLEYLHLVHNIWSYEYDGSIIMR